MLAAATTTIRGLGRQVIDFALPPRCPGCGIITGQIQSFCADCWNGIEWLGDNGCRTCGVPLEATELESCGACLARKPVIDRSRAAVAYGETTRILPLRLKYSRKVALAGTMARYMRPLVDDSGDPLFVPVPLHRRRLWWRGFNQAALLAGELARRCGGRVDPFALVRSKPTSALKGMSPVQRRREVAGAFAVSEPAAVAGRKIILVDDVHTTGSTAEACAKVLRRAGASRVELICWARVVRPVQLMR
jgi:ComF family protein